MSSDAAGASVEPVQAHETDAAPAAPVAAAPSDELRGPSETAHPTGRLYAEAMAHLERRNMLATLLDSECTFKPKTNKGRPSTAGARQEGADSSLPAHERLFQKSAEKDQKIKQKLEEQARAFTFTPQLSTKAHGAKAAAKGPIHESLYEKAKELRERLKARQEAAAAELVFKPTLTKRAQEMKRPGSAADRLYDPDWVRSRRADERNNYDARIASEFQFRPQVNPNASNTTAAVGGLATAAAAGAEGEGGLGASTVSAGDPGNPNNSRSAASPRAGGGSGGGSIPTSAVFDRLYGVSKVHADQHAIAVKQHEDEEMARCTFRPDTHKSKNSAKKLLGITVAPPVVPAPGDLASATAAAVAAASPGGDASGKGAAAGGAGADAHSRLYLHALERAERLRQAALLAQKAEEEQCTFKPNISEGSRRIADGSSGGTGSTAAAPGAATTSTDGNNEEGEGASASHQQHPRIPRHLLLYEDGLQRQQQRAALDANKERTVTEDDLINCTFRPHITQSQALGGGSPMGSSARGGHHHDHGSDHASGASVHDRLYDNAKARAAALAAASSAVPLQMASLGPSEVAQAVAEATMKASSRSSANKGKSGPTSSRNNSGRKATAAAGAATGSASSPSAATSLAAALAAMSPPSLPPALPSPPSSSSLGNSSSGGGMAVVDLRQEGASASKQHAATSNGSGGGGSTSQRNLFPVSAPTSPFTVPPSEDKQEAGAASGGERVGHRSRGESVNVDE